MKTFKVASVCFLGVVLSAIVISVRKKRRIHQEEEDDESLMILSNDYVSFYDEPGVYF